VQVQISFPVQSPQQIIDAVSAALETHGDDVKVCVFSHVSSFPSVILPVDELAKVCKMHSTENNNILVLIDGAHAPGLVDIDMERLAAAGADYYCGNLHKWCFAPKG
jgi:selenocysteine lyase/cysteine desulfurase